MASGATFREYDQIMTTGLCDTVASKYDNMRGVIIPTKCSYRKHDMWTILVLPEEGTKAKKLTVKSKYLQAHPGQLAKICADPPSVIFEDDTNTPVYYGRAKKSFGKSRFGEPTLAQRRNLQAGGHTSKRWQGGAVTNVAPVDAQGPTTSAREQAAIDGQGGFSSTGPSPTREGWNMFN